MRHSAFSKQFGPPLLAVFALAGCATRTSHLPAQEVVPAPGYSHQVFISPCEAEGIEVRPIAEVTRSELNQRLRDGQYLQTHRGDYLFYQQSLSSRLGGIFWPLVGAALGQTLGQGSGRTAGAVVGGVVGGTLGDWHSSAARQDILVRFAACKQYLNGLNTAPGGGTPIPLPGGRYPDRWR